MGTVLTAIMAAVLLAVVAAYALPTFQEPSYEAFATSSVRVGEPGSNLVGADWHRTTGPKTE